MINLPHWPKIPIWQHNQYCSIAPRQNLDHLKIILGNLGNPHKYLPPTIHVAGTNGKGSTIAMLKSIFESAGYKVHSYTSPHLVEFNERINLSGQSISDYYLLELLEIVRSETEKLNITVNFFEGITIAAFLAFMQTPADLLLLETGMGGRLDATNLVERPLLTIMTSISYDHMQYLGTSLQAIANEKAGIIKHAVPCVIAAQVDEVYEALLAKCNLMESPAFCYEYDYSIMPSDKKLIYRSKKYDLSIPMPSLLGYHQFLNASAAIASTMLLNDNYKISKNDIATGLINTKWPGRIEKIELNKYSKFAYSNIKFYLDGAHNDAGAYALAMWIKENLDPPVYLIIGMTKNRNIESFCRAFQDIVSYGKAVKVTSEPSSYHPDTIVDSARKCNVNIESCESLNEAITELGSLANTTNATIVITGSLFLISDFYKLIEKD